VVYARRLEDRTFTFIVSGKLWRNSLIMQDEETGSLWSHVSGTALYGTMQGQELELFPTVQTTWAEWVAEHTDTDLLKKEEAVRSSHYERYFKDPDRIGIFRARWLEEQMAGKTLVHGLTHGLHALAVANHTLVARSLVNAELGARPVVVFRAPDGVRAFLAEAEGQTLTFSGSDNPPAIIDTETGSTWNLALGVCVGGALDGFALEEIVIRTAYWFAWSGFFPNTEVID